MWKRTLSLWLVAVPAAAQQMAPLQPGEALLQVSGTGKVQAVPDVTEVDTGVLSRTEGRRGPAFSRGIGLGNR